MWSGAGRVALVVLLGTVQACSTREVEIHHQVTGPAAQLNADVPLPRNIRPEEAHLAELSRAVSGFGGAYLDPTGNVVVNLVDLSRSAGSEMAVRQVLGSHGLARTFRKDAAVRYMPARFSFAQLATWRDALVERALSSGVVNFVDLDEMNNRVTLGVRTSMDAAATRRLATEVGVDTAALRFELVGEYRDASSSVLSAAMTSPPCSTLGSHGCSPIVGGLGVGGNSALGYATLGFVVSHNGVQRWITASHATSVKFGGDATAFRQATWANGTDLGSETYDKPYWNCSVFRCRNSDASLMAFAAGAAGQVGLIARTQSPSGPGQGNGSLTISSSTPYFKILDVTGPGGVMQGQEVHKVGRVSGWTYGYVTSTCADYNTGGVLPPWYKVNCADRANMLVDDGDSGSPVFLRVDAELATLTGLVTGRDGTSSVISRYAGVRGDLEQGSAWSAVRTPSLGVATISGTVSGGYPALTWTSVAGATNYDVRRQRWQLTGWDEFGNPTYDSVIEWIGSVSATSMTDPQFTVINATGSGCAWWEQLAYWVRATSETELSQPSANTLFCRTP